MPRLRPDFLQNDRQKFRRLFVDRLPRTNDQRTSQVFSQQTERTGNDRETGYSGSASGRFENGDGRTFKSRNLVSPNNFDFFFAAENLALKNPSRVEINYWNTQY